MFYTLLLVLFLVIAVIYIFLQNWRASLIPLMTIPVSLISTLERLKMMDYSINMITLFGLILAIRIAVDDDIAVVDGLWWDSQARLPDKNFILRRNFQ